ncbi:MAG: hypothetical protein BZ151_01795 [Desulfobacca sp. 4484_104]|nr:MAG: hypothetical protein BZ151_01795 [Desulfobacca sp. 4484_104]RLA88793.1 MAG: hypothetical protein DRG58_06940 [Deltaproteobacteria bacterium]
MMKPRFLAVIMGLMICLCYPAWSLAYEINLYPDSEHDIAPGVIAQVGGSPVMHGSLVHTGARTWVDSTTATWVNGSETNLAGSEWGISVSEPIVTWDSDGFGKTTSFTTRFDVVSLWAHVESAGITAKAGERMEMRTYFEPGIREDALTDPEIWIDINCGGPDIASDMKVWTWMAYRYNDVFFQRNLYVISDASSFLNCPVPPRNMSDEADPALALDHFLNPLAYTGGVTGKYCLSLKFVDEMEWWNEIGDFDHSCWVEATINIKEPNIAAVVVPLPPAMLLFGGGLLGLCVVGRRKKS